MAYFNCPHCQQPIELLLGSLVQAPTAPEEGAYSTTVRVDQVQAILTGDGYHPNPLKLYRTSEAKRRAGLARYYQQREQILQRAKDQRAKRSAGLPAEPAAR